MKASVDTDIIIHLYKSGKKELLFTTFDELYIYEYLFQEEVQKKSLLVYQELRKDIASKRLTLITNKDLIKRGVKGLFDRYKQDYNYLFDIGELQAVALAKALGLAALLSDDTKDQGPHQTLVRELIEGVIPFAFYELLLLKYLESNITLEELFQEFEDVNKHSLEHTMNFKTKYLIAVKRFTKKYGSKRDNDWMENYCRTKNIAIKAKMRELKNFLNSLE